jgi:Questin oxidase-like
MANFAVSAYASFDDFTLLHAVTATHAFRRVLPFIADPDLATRYLWHSIVVAAMSSGVPLHASWPDTPRKVADWATIAEKAIGSDDEHVIKLAYSAMAEFQHYANPLYQMVATRQVASKGRGA